MLRQRRALLGGATVVGLLAAMAGRELTLDRSIEHMFAPHDPILEPYRRLQRTFGRHEILLAAYPDPEFATPAGLDRVRALAERLRRIDGVAAVVTVLDPPGAADFAGDPRGEAFREVFAGYTHSAALDAGGAICLIERPEQGDPAERAAARRRTLAEVRAALVPLPGSVAVGEPVLMEEAFDLLEADGRRLNTWCTLLVLLTIVAAFGSVRWVLLPLAVVQLALASTRAVLVLGSLQLSMVSSMLSAIVTVVGVATVVHVMVRYRDGLDAGREPLQALGEACEQLARPVLFACLTDAVGFASLMLSAVGPVHDFGFMTAIGSLLTIPATAATVPALALFGQRRGDRRAAADSAAAPRRRRLDAALASVLTMSPRRARLCGAAGLTAAAGLALGAAQLERETDFTRNFRDDSELVRAYRFVETRFGGAGVWDVLLPAPARLSRSFLVRVLDLEAHLIATAPTLGKAISLADALDAGLGGLRGLQLEVALRGALSLLRARMPEFIDAVSQVDPADARPWLRIMLRAPERLEAESKTELIEQVRSAVQQKFPGAEVTGYYVLLTELIQSVLADQWTTFAAATAAILATMAWAFRCWKLAVLALVPNVLPVFALFGAMGWLGLRINMGAAMIAAVSVGLSVDGSIHYLMDYRRRQSLGCSPAEALEQVQSAVGRAATLSTLALVVGFSTLAASDFVPTIYFGVLVSLSMIGGLAGNLVALPLMLRGLHARRG